MERRRTGVAIVGGGPAGTTVGCLLKKYAPELEVSIFERESFPRDHIGESQLPAITRILAEMGVWGKVEAAGFPVKLGGAYRWGATDEIWYLDFIPPGTYENLPRPAPYTPQRESTAFQVDRSAFDKILLDHAEEMGCQVYRKTKIAQVNLTDQYVTSLRAEPEGGEPFEVKSRYYVDASGEGGVIRKAVGVEVDFPTSLRNVAFWDYWQETAWAERIGDAATRIQVMSLGWGWIWFIPISETRTSIGLVLPAEHYKSLGKRPEKIYLEAVRAEPMIRKLTEGATREGRFTTTKDWNFLSSCLAGQNWFLVGDSCGFADPILSAGMTLAHTSGRKVAYSILELQRKRLSADWIRQQYNEGHRHQIRHHMRFAEFWYAGNGRFTDLKEYCSQLAATAGLKLDPEQAFLWLGTGGFALDTIGMPVAATFPIWGVKTIASHITGSDCTSILSGKNMVRRQADGARAVPFASYENGKIRAVQCLVRGSAQLPYEGAFNLLMEHMAEQIEIDLLIRIALEAGRRMGAPKSRLQPDIFVNSLEALVAEGWATAFADESKPASKFADMASPATR